MARRSRRYMRLGLVLAALVTLGRATPSCAAELWYQDPLQGRRNLTEFVEKFENSESFKRAAAYINVYSIPIDLLLRLHDRGRGREFLSNVLFPFFSKQNIKFAVETGGARWMDAHLRGGRFDRDIELLRALKQGGGRVDYVSFQSLLSKRRPQLDDYSLQERVDDAVRYAKAIRDVHPEVKFGLIDALPSHGRDYKEPYRILVEAFRKAGLNFAYIHLDAPFEIPYGNRNGLSWKSIGDLEKYVEDDLKIDFGLYAVSRQGGQTSSKMFHEQVIKMLDCYAGSGRTPRDYVVTSWFRFPDKVVSADASATDYPAMRTVLEFGQRLKQIDRREANAQIDANWHSKCERQPG